MHSKGAEGYTQLAQEVIANAEKRAGTGLGASFGSLNPRFRHLRPNMPREPPLPPLQHAKTMSAGPQQIDIDSSIPALISSNAISRRALDELARSIRPAA